MKTERLVRSVVCVLAVALAGSPRPAAAQELNLLDGRVADNVPMLHTEFGDILLTSMAGDAATPPAAPSEPASIAAPITSEASVTCDSGVSCDSGVACESRCDTGDGGWFGLHDDGGAYWFAGTEITFVNMDIRSGGIITASASDTTAPGIATQSVRDGNGLNDVIGFGPRLWLGRQFSENWGVVGRFYNVEASEQNNPPRPNPSIPTTGTNFATIFETDRGHVQAIDLEAVRTFRPGKWKIDGSLGSRYARVGADSDVLAFGVFTTGNFINVTLQNGFVFNGVGGTGAINARRQLGDGPMSFFCGFRASYLGGHTDSFGRAAGTVASSPSAPPAVGAATVSRRNADGELDIIEYQVGLQWDYALRRAPVNAFFRTAFEYQFWDVDAPPTGGAGFGDTVGELTANSFASAGIGGAHLYGLVIGTGFTY